MGTKLLGTGAWRRARVALVSLVAAVTVLAVALPAPASAASYRPHRFGLLDCNGQSTAQKPLTHALLCTDIRGFARVNNQNTWGGRFYDNGEYIGHDEPDMTFLSSQPGSGNNVTWTETLGSDPSAAPTVSTPGSDVSHYFELTPAPWFSMQMCDPRSYPLEPCTPLSDSNAPRCFGTHCTNAKDAGAGSAFMEMQLYAPGYPPFSDAVSCDDSHWCAALTVDSLECNLNFVKCNPACTEPVNFAFIQRNGVPAGPPSPQEADLTSFTPNSQTLLMDPGDTIQVHMWDAPVPGHPGQSAFEVTIDDMTTGQSGFMQASAANGFHDTSIDDCSGRPFNFQPEYSTAGKNEISPWAALQTDISTEFETGHFEPCTSLSDPFEVTPAPGATDLSWNRCHGPYEDTAPGGDGKTVPEIGDAYCFPAGDTHGDQHSAPDEITGCEDNYFQNGDLDFDGTPYWAEWPTGTSPTALYPGSFVESLPVTNGAQYAQFFIQTDIALSESTCTPKGEHCAVPPPNAPGKFYPYWSRATTPAGCTLEFGNVSSGVNDFGKDAGYGTDQVGTLGFNEFEGPVMSNACST